MTTGRINQVNIFSERQKLTQQFQTQCTLRTHYDIGNPTRARTKGTFLLSLSTRILIFHEKDKNTMLIPRIFFVSRFQI